MDIARPLKVPPPLSLYVHLPWCVSKCPYCDFNSHAAGDSAPREKYIDALVADLDQEATLGNGRELISVFLGGGTPSFFAPDQIARLLDAINNRFQLAADAEITMEANPGTVECGDPAGYRAAGVNRLSIGAQSFNPESLVALGRIHSVEDIGRTVAASRAAGFDNINIDLMYALPGQDSAAAVVDIERAAETDPQHVSWYQLTLEPNTVFHARPPSGLPDEDTCYEIQVRGQERLATLGYEQYEVSAYAREGRRSVHNLNYWQFGDYLAAGAGAHGKISDSEGIWRYSKPANPRQFINCAEQGVPVKPVSPADRLFEFMLNASRLTDGFDAELFESRTGLPAAILEQRLAGPIGKGLVVASAGNVADGEKSWRVTALGRRFLNDLQSDFLPD